MKSKIIIGLCAVFVTVACCTIGVEAAGMGRQGAFAKSQQNNVYCENDGECDYTSCGCGQYKDENNDGICDNCLNRKYVDEDGDGICDNCLGVHCSDSDRICGSCSGTCYSDTDGDGVCDNSRSCLNQGKANHHTGVHKSHCGK